MMLSVLMIMGTSSAFAFSDDVDDVFGPEVHAVAVFAGDDKGGVAQPPNILTYRRGL
jgi:hypothetical protein